VYVWVVLNRKCVCEARVGYNLEHSSMSAVGATENLNIYLIFYRTVTIVFHTRIIVKYGAQKKDVDAKAKHP